jgi:hypothetical protein
MKKTVTKMMLGATVLVAVAVVSYTRRATSSRVYAVIRPGGKTFEDPGHDQRGMVA